MKGTQLEEVDDNDDDDDDDSSSSSDDDVAVGDVEEKRKSQYPYWQHFKDSNNEKHHKHHHHHHKHHKHKHHDHHHDEWNPKKFLKKVRKMIDEVAPGAFFACMDEYNPCN